MTPHLLRRLTVWVATALVMLALPLAFTPGIRAVAAQSDRHRRDLRPVLQHAARADRDAVLRARRVLRSGRLRQRACPQRDGRRRSACAGDAAAAGGRACGTRLRRRLGLRHHAAIGHSVRDDLARHRRNGRRLCADVPRLLRRRGRHRYQPRGRAALARPHLRSADPGLLPHRRLVLRVHDRDVRIHPDAAGADGQCGARQCRAGEVRGLQSQPRALPGLLSGVLLRRHRRRAGHASTTRSSPPRTSAWRPPAAC